MTSTEVASTYSPSPARGVRFGRLLVLRFEGRRKGRRTWRCVCDCGRHRIVSTRLLTTGTTKSCGCLLIDVGRQKMTARNRTVTGVVAAP